MTDVIIPDEYYTKLESFYTKQQSKDIINKLIDETKQYCKSNNLTNDNLCSITINHINELYEDNKVNKIDYTKLDIYLAQNPQERCPKLWEEVIKKIEFIEEKKHNIYTTDIYECFRCHKRKCTIEIIQTRSADEPATTFVNCIVCGNHWAT
jgi:DNA-directed RNA polymerase subunit M/transcription elongation factor TFIIS